MNLKISWPLYSVELKNYCFSFRPLHVIQCVEKASALVLINRWAVPYLRLKSLPVPPNQSHGSKAHSHCQQVQMKDYFSSIPTCAWQGAMFVSLWWFFLSSGEGRTGTRQQKPSSLVSLVLAHSGSAGTFWGKHWAFCRQRWHSKTWIWSWTQPKSWKDHLNPSQ